MAGLAYCLGLGPCLNRTPLLARRGAISSCFVHNGSFTTHGSVPRRSTKMKTRSGSIRVDVNLVLIPVLVTGPYERPVRGLQKSAFRLFEDGVEREIPRFFQRFDEERQHAA